MYTYKVYIILSTTIQKIIFYYIGFEKMVKKQKGRLRDPLKNIRIQKIKRIKIPRPKDHGGRNPDTEP